MSWRSPRLARRVWQICGTSGLFRTKRLASETPLLKHFDAGTLHLRYFLRCAREADQLSGNS